MNEAYNRDCLEAMKEYPDGFFDLCVADPPYGIKITSRHRERERERASSSEEMADRSAVWRYAEVTARAGHR